MPGLIGADDITDSLGAKNIVSGVLTAAVEMSELLKLCASVPVPKLTGTVPVMTSAGVQEDVGEFEVTEIEGSAFTNVAFDLKKDRVFVASSDEAAYKSGAGDPLTLQINSAGLRLASIMDKKIAAALCVDPQNVPGGNAWATITANPLMLLAEAIAKVKPYKADFIVMDPDVYTAYLQLDFMETTAAYSPSNATGSVAKIPGVDLDVYTNSNVTADSALVGCSLGAPAVVGNGPVKVRQWDEPSLGAELYQMDVFRQAKAPVFKNDAGLNMSVCQITALI